MYVCVCHAVTERHLRESIRAGALTDLDEVEEATGAGGCCGQCRGEVAFILQDERVQIAAGDADVVQAPVPPPVRALAAVPAA